MYSNSVLSLSQNMIASLIGASPQTVLRAIKELKLHHVNPESLKIKKYSFEDTRTICNYIKPKDQKISKKIHVFYNLKGGTGKTSVCYQLGFHLSIIGYKVLFLDCDPQGHLSTALNFPEDGNYNTLYDILINSIPFNESIVSVMPGLAAVPSNLSLSRVEVPLSQKARREDRLSEIIYEIIDKYDFIFIDTNPYISTLNLNALVAADHVNLVCETAPFSLYGLRVLLEETTRFFAEMKKPLNYKIIANKYESRTATSQEVLGYIRSNYKENVMNSVIRKSEDINISTKEKLPIASFCKKNSVGLEDIKDLMTEIISLSS